MTITPYYQDDHATIYHGDSLEIMPELAGVIDMVFTSPPYNLGVTAGGGMHKGSLAASDLAGGYGEHDDAMPVDVYDEWQTKCVAAMWETLTENGAVFYNHKPRPWAKTLKLPTAYGTDLPLRQIVTWARHTGMNFSESFFLPTYEWIMIWAKEQWKLTSRSAGKIGSVWHVRPETDGAHPAPFPLKLPTLAINATEATMILDPFMGSGTTLRAAKDLGRHSIGIELEEKYCEIAATRLGQEVLDLGI